MPTEADGEEERSGDGGGDLGDGEKPAGNAAELHRREAAKERWQTDWTLGCPGLGASGCGEDATAVAGWRCSRVM